MSEEKLYTLEQARVIGRRANCESSRHEIIHLIRQLNGRGELVLSRYGCQNCDVIVDLRYPPLG